MVNPAQQTLMAIVKLEGNVFFREFREHLERRLESFRQNLSRCGSDLEFRWTQGRAQELEDTLKLIQTAYDKVQEATTQVQKDLAIKPL